jgi:hypothetical protein
MANKCSSCGEDHAAANKSAVLVHALHCSEEQAERLGNRVRELESAIKAVLTGSVKVEVLRELVAHAA